MGSSKNTSADTNLAPENYRELNRAFYAAKPSDYFSQRLENLMLVAGRHQDLDRLTSEGLEYRGLKVGGDDKATEGKGDGSTVDPEDRAKSAEHFVIAEAETLSQHVGETLLRLYMAHAWSDGESPPACPWLDISRLRSFSKAKELVRGRFGPESDPEDPVNLRAVARVFYLSDKREELTETPMAEDRWQSSLANIEGYLRVFAQQFLDRAALYNAAKHGLALLPSEMKMKLGDGELIRAEGPTIQYLEVRNDDDGTPRWFHNHHWVKPDRQMALIHRGIVLIETLWEAAKLRYLPEDRPETMQLALFGGPTWWDIFTSGSDEAGGVVIEDMAMGLLYYEPPPDAVEQSAAATQEAGGDDDRES